MTLDELLALLPDNQHGDISASDLRTIVTELYGPLANEFRVAQGPFTLPAAASFSPLPTPGPIAGLMTVVESGPVLLSLSVYVDSGANNNDVSLGLDLTGATVVAVGGPGKTVRVGGKQYVQSTLSNTYLQEFNEGDTLGEVMYKATLSGAIVSDLSINMVSLIS